MLRHLWRQFQTQLLTRPSLALIVAAIIALSLASAERTFEGMRNFTGGQTLSATVSVLITFGVQILLLVLAWYIGDAYATGNSLVITAAAQPGRVPSPSDWKSQLSQIVKRNFFVRNFMLVLSFGVCAMICVFFSFDAFYQGISSEDHRKQVSDDAALEIVRRIDTDLTQKLEAQQSSIAVKLASGTGWQQYKKRLDDVVSAAGNRDVADSLKARGEDLHQQEVARLGVLSEAMKAAEAKINAADLVRSEAESVKVRLQSELRKQDEELAALEIRQKALSKELDDKQVEIDQALALRDNEDKNGNGTLKPNGEPNTGKGDKYRKYDKAYNDQQDERRNLVKKKKEFDLDLGSKHTARNETEAKVRKAGFELANAEAELRAVRAMSGGQSSSPSGSAEILLPSAEKLAGEKAKLELAQVTFLNGRTRDNWANIEKQCNQVVGMLRELPDGHGRISALDCSAPAETRTVADNLFAVEQRRKDLKDGCSATDLSKLNFFDLIAHGRKCLSIARLDEKDVAALGSQLMKVNQEQNRDAHTFVRTLNAFERGDSLAYTAAVIALSLDGLIFLCGIWGARANLSHLTRHGDERAAEFDDHANMTMALETRPEKLRPSGGWPEPAEVYKARVFLRKLKPYANPGHPEFGGAISYHGLNELERETVKCVLMIGLFAQQLDKSDTWIVTSRLIRYLTRIAATYDRLQRLQGAGAVPSTATDAARTESLEKPESEVPAGSYWASAAVDANRLRTGSGVLPESEDEFVDIGFRKFKEEASQPTTPVDVANDNPLAPDTQNREDDASRSAAG